MSGWRPRLLDRRTGLQLDDMMSPVKERIIIKDYEDDVAVY